jgi:hypothetical protein
MKKQLKWRNHIFHLCHQDKHPILPLYHPYHLCIPPYTTCAGCGGNGGIQLISGVGSFHIGPFPTVV